MKTIITLLTALVLFIGCENFEEFDTTCMQITADVQKRVKNMGTLYTHPSITLDAKNNFRVSDTKGCVARFNFTNQYGREDYATEWNSFLGEMKTIISKNKDPKAYLQVYDEGRPKDETKYAEVLDINLNTNSTDLIITYGHQSYWQQNGRGIELSSSIFETLNNLNKPYKVKMNYQFSRYTVYSLSERQLETKTFDGTLGKIRSNTTFTIPSRSDYKYLGYQFFIDIEGNTYRTKVFSVNTVDIELDGFFNSIKNVDTVLYSNPLLRYDFSQVPNFQHTYYGESEYDFSTQTLGSFNLLNWTSNPSFYKNSEVNFRFYLKAGGKTHKLTKDIYFFDLERSMDKLVSSHYTIYRNKIGYVKVQFNVPSVAKDQIKEVHVEVYQDGQRKYNRDYSSLETINIRSFNIIPPSYYRPKLHDVKIEVKYELRDGNEYEKISERKLVYDWSYYHTPPSSLQKNGDTYLYHNFKNMFTNSDVVQSVDFFVMQEGQNTFSKMNNSKSRNSYFTISNPSQGECNYYYRLKLKNISEYLYSGVYSVDVK